jgi:P-type Ca2+ transporter type 2C
VFLTLANRSFHYSIFTTLRYKNYLVPVIIGITLLFIVAMLTIPFMQQLFGLTSISWTMLATSLAVAFICSFWIELPKMFTRPA